MGECEAGRAVGRNTRPCGGSGRCRVSGICRNTQKEGPAGRSPQARFALAVVLRLPPTSQEDPTPGEGGAEQDQTRGLRGSDRPREQGEAVGAIIRTDDRHFRGDEVATGESPCTGSVEQGSLGGIEGQYEPDAPVTEVHACV